MNAVALMIESFVAILLVVTIVYCMMLNRRLKAMRLDEKMFRRTIDDLLHATGVAEQAIRTLKKTADYHEIKLQEAIHQSGRLSERLEQQINTAQVTLNGAVAHGSDEAIFTDFDALDGEAHNRPDVIENNSLQAYEDVLNQEVEVKFSTDPMALDREPNGGTSVLDRARDAVRRVREKHGLGDERDRKLFDQEFAA